MTYYIINAETNRILGSCESEPNPQDEANHYDCSVWIIEGEHSGLAAEPQTKVAPEPEQDSQRVSDLEKLAAWEGR